MKMELSYPYTCLQHVPPGSAPTADQCKACYSSLGCCPSAATQVWGTCAPGSFSSLVHCVPYDQGCALEQWRLWVAVLVPIGAVLLACVLWAAFVPPRAAGASGDAGRRRRPAEEKHPTSSRRRAPAPKPVAEPIETIADYGAKGRELRV